MTNEQKKGRNGAYNKQNSSVAKEIPSETFVNDPARSVDVLRANRRFKYLSKQSLNHDTHQRCQDLSIL